MEDAGDFAMPLYPRGHFVCSLCFFPSVVGTGRHVVLAMVRFLSIMWSKARDSKGCPESSGLGRRQGSGF